MKIQILIITGLLFLASATQAQTPATEAGEDFDLYGVISLFEQSEDLEDFEKKLNSEDNDVNNLDLNADEEVDMIRVVEYGEDNTHLLVLQAVLGDNDYQDLATIELEKHGDNDISGQLVGDEEIYGPDYIIEPSPEEASISASYSLLAVYVSVHAWRPVGVIFRPGRALFVTAVIWAPRPIWFRPRSPMGRSAFRGKAGRWKSPRYRSTPSRHSKKGKSMYSSKRRSSPTAKKNYGGKPKSSAASPAKTSNKQKQQTQKQQQPKQQQPKQQTKQKQQTKPKQQSPQQKKKR